MQFSISTNHVNVKASCIPEMKKDRTYSILMTLNKVTVNVSSAQCTCPAGQRPYSNCKHLAALCFTLKDFAKISDAALEQGKDTCMSLLQNIINQGRKY